MPVTRIAAPDGPASGATLITGLAVTVNVALAKRPLLDPRAPTLCGPVGANIGTVIVVLKWPLLPVVVLPRSTVPVEQSGCQQ